MTGRDEAALPQDFLEEVRDALAHYHDQAHLLRHPLLRRLQRLVGPEPMTAVQELRRLLARAVEELRPQVMSLSDPALRPYAVLHGRYILGKELAQLEKELALGHRQLLREQRKGLEAVALALWQWAHGANPSPVERDSSLAGEIARLASDRRPIEVSALLQEAVGLLDRLCQEYQVRLSLAPAGPVYTLANPTLLRQLFIASISFALRSAPGARLELSLARFGQAGRLACTAALPGGHNPLALPPLPEPLLTLARSQGAGITLQGVPGGFRLELELPPGRSLPLVVIVEDNGDTVQLLSRYLASQGYRVAAIEDGASALQALQELSPDVILLDVMMSGVDGWQVLQQLKAHPSLCRVPVVVCTVLDEPELARALGAAGYLRKPVKPAQLLSCLARVSAQ